MYKNTESAFYFPFLSCLYSISKPNLVDLIWVDSLILVLVKGISFDDRQFYSYCKDDPLILNSSNSLNFYIERSALIFTLIIIRLFIHRDKVLTFDQLLFWVDELIDLNVKVFIINLLYRMGKKPTKKVTKKTTLAARPKRATKSKSKMEPGKKSCKNCGEVIPIHKKVCGSCGHVNEMKKKRK